MRNYQQDLLNQPVDVSADFAGPLNLFFGVSKATGFSDQESKGELEWQRFSRKPRMAFDQVVRPLEPETSWEFPPEYSENYQLPLAISFVDERTIRLRFHLRPHQPWRQDGQSLMLAGPVACSDAWQAQSIENGIAWRSSAGQLILRRDPFHLELRDATGRLLTQTHHPKDTTCLVNHVPPPFGFVRRADDLQRTAAASFLLSPGEHLYGCGESFTQLDKRGQKIILCTSDAYGAQTTAMYKPIPFYMSSRGYAVFVHGSAPMTFDLGHSYDNAAVLYNADEELDIFLFVGEPKELLSAYTSLTGRSPVPPAWSFGLWMSRITYKSEEETRTVARKLRDCRIPCDVIHLDTGWFETDWRCNYKFSPSRFLDPAGMIRDLRADGFRISLWQLPYFTPKNELFAEAVAKGYVVTNGMGGLATEDAIVDFSNPAATRWYQELLRPLLAMGVGAIKVDFGESAPLYGLYASGRTGLLEHNLYPLRYNQAAFEITRQVTGDSIIWARSAWAGSQRYPLHWSGDAETTDTAMAATLRAGLSFGLCGFSFWSHDIGGFSRRSPRGVYRRWMPFGMLTSQSRCHGNPPREPWYYDDAFTDDFRRAVELKYRLMPYIYTQACLSSANGWPMLRTLFFEYPNDPTSWLIDHQYLFGSDLLVAPLLEETSGRGVYCPPGKWHDYQTGKVYQGAAWHHIEAGEIPVVLLVRDGAVIPHCELAQSTQQIDWNKLTLKVFSTQTGELSFALARPGELAPQGHRLAWDGKVNELPWR